MAEGPPEGGADVGQAFGEAGKYEVVAARGLELREAADPGSKVISERWKQPCGKVLEIVEVATSTGGVHGRCEGGWLTLVDGEVAVLAGVWRRAVGGAGPLAAYLATKPDAAQEKDKYGKLPLHLAAQNQAPEGTVRLLCEAFPESVREKDGNGNLPLHRAARYQAPEGTVRVLCEAFPESVREKDKYGRLPLHLAAQNQAPEGTVRLLCEAFPESVREKDGDGKLPLHLAARNQAPEGTVRVLCEAFPESALQEYKESDPAAALPKGWKAVVSRSTGDTYYQNTATGETTWDRPTAAIAELKSYLPLELAAQGKCAVAVLKLLADALPGRLETQSSTGATFHALLLADERAEVREFATTYGAFLGRYKLLGERVHSSATCLVIFAYDLEGKRNVALKLMHNEVEWRREQDMRLLDDDAEQHLDSRHVVPLLLARELTEAEAASDSRVQGEDSYRFLLVMPRAKRDLSDALAHYRFAGRERRQVVEILVQVATHLRYLNEICGRIHGDLKPRNLILLELDTVDEDGVVTGTEWTWCVIDLDASCKIGDVAGQKITSSAYFPPEMARRELAAVDDAQRPSVVASVGFEMWYFGCLVYQLCTLDGATLWLMNQADNIDEADLHTLAHKWPELRAAKMDKIVWPQAKHLVEWLLQEDVCRRPKSWEQVMQHPFLLSEAAAATHKRVVMSCPEMGTIDPDGCSGPYDQNVMEKVSQLQQIGYVKFGFDRAGTSTAREKDGALFEQAFALRDEGKHGEATELLKSTDWWYGYQTSVKQAVKLECQGFEGELDVTCVKGGFITQLEAAEMGRIMSEAKDDCLKSGITVNYKITEVSYYDFLSEYEPVADGGAPTSSAASVTGPQQVERECAQEGERGHQPPGSHPENEQLATLQCVIEQNNQVIAAKDEELAAKDEELAALKEQLRKLQQPAEGEPPV
jgi:serine/threonine protein kinase